VTSYLTDDFLQLYRRLPIEIRQQARKAYQLWRINPMHPSLHFKRVHATEPLYSAPISRSWRVLGLMEDDAIYWFWIGSHADYDQLLARF
jgi:hypothetical protein